MGAGWTSAIVSAQEEVTAPGGVGEVVKPGGGSGEAEGEDACSRGSHDRERRRRRSQGSR